MGAKAKPALQPKKKKASADTGVEVSGDDLTGLSRDLILIVAREDLRVLSCSPAACELYGVRPEQLVGRSLLDLSPKNERKVAERKLRRSAPGKKELHHLRGDGAPIFIELETLSIVHEGCPAFFCRIYDLTAQSQRIQALLESDAANREIIENASDIIYTHDLDGNLLSGNRAATQILGYTRQEYIGLNLAKIVAPEDLGQVRRSIREKLERKQSTSSYPLHVLAKDGKRHALEVSTRLIYKDGKAVAVQGIARDTTERERVLQALQDSEAKFRAMADAAPCGIGIFQNDKLLYANRMMTRIFGHTPEELLNTDEAWQIITPEFRDLVRQRAHARLRGEDVPAHYEFKVFHKNGEERWVDFTGGTFEYEGRRASLVILFDITERKTVQSKANEAQRLFRLLFERNLAGVFVSEIDGKLIDCNDSFAQIFGYRDRMDALGQPAGQYYFAAPERKEFIAKLRRSRYLTNHEYQCRRKDGSAFWVLENVALLEDSSEGTERIQGTLIDITERKQTEAALIESESKFRAVADTASSAIYIHNGKEFLYVNRASEEITGYSADELMGLPVASIVHEDDKTLVMQRSLARLQGDDRDPRYEFRIVRKDGGFRWLDFSGTTVTFEGEIAVLGTAFDVTERKRSERLQNALYRIAEASLSVKDLQHFYGEIHRIVGELMYASNLYIALFDPWAETLTYPYYADERDDPPVGEIQLGQGRTEFVLRRGQPTLLTPETFETLARAGEMELVGSPCVDWMGVPLKDGSKTFGVLVLQSYDHSIRYSDRDLDVLNFVSQQVASAILRKRNEDALRDSELRYRSMVQSAVYGIYRASPDDHFLEVNPAMVQMLGYSSLADLVKLRISKDVYVDLSDRQLLMDRYKNSGHVDNIEVRWKRKDGKLITVRLSGRAVLRPDGTIDSFEMIAEDVTERRALEEQLRQSQKMEAVGRLAGGVAHDFNNLLTVIKGYSDLLLEEFKPTDPLRSEVDEIRKAADRAASLTRQLLAFSRQQVLAPKVFGLNSVVSNMDRLLRRLLGADVDLQTVLSDALGRVKADPGQIEQVIMNLAVNARDAMPQGGKLTIETANVWLDDQYALEHLGGHAGSYVMIAVSDNGIGMSESVRQRIFEPFFTTKEVGKGTGLGLSTVYGIVKQSGGYVWVYSEVGIGTTFKVYLPRVDAPADVNLTSDSSHTPHAGTETVLLVEDEDGVRALVRQVLSKQGYTVLEASHGGEALLHCERHQEHIHLLVTDVVLERMSGPELAGRLLTIRPDLKVLYVSGYTDDAIIHQGVLTQGTAFLQKPFTTDALLKKVRQVLDHKR